MKNFFIGLLTAGCVVLVGALIMYGRPKKLVEPGPIAQQQKPAPTLVHSNAYDAILVGNVAILLIQDTNEFNTLTNIYHKEYRAKFGINFYRE